MLKPKNSNQNWVLQGQISPWRWTFSSLVGITRSKGCWLRVIERSSNILLITFLGHSVHLIQCKKTSCQHFCSGLFLSKFQKGFDRVTSMTKIASFYILGQPRQNIMTATQCALYYFKRQRWIISSFALFLMTDVREKPKHNPRRLHL